MEYVWRKDLQMEILKDQSSKNVSISGGIFGLVMYPSSWSIPIDLLNNNDWNIKLTSFTRPPTKCGQTFPLHFSTNLKASRHSIILVNSWCLLVLNKSWSLQHVPPTAFTSGLQVVSLLHLNLLFTLRRGYIDQTPVDSDCTSCNPASWDRQKVIWCPWWEWQLDCDLKKSPETRFAWFRNQNG